MNESERGRLRREIRERFEARLDAMVEEAAKFADTPCAATLLSMEKNVNAILDRIGDDVTGCLVKDTAGSLEFQAGVVDGCKKNSASTTGGATPPCNSSTGRS